MSYREIAPPPSDKTAVLILICSVIERHVGRLEDLLAEHEEIEAVEAAARYDRAALDCSPAFERHRRYQSARHRELLRTQEAFRKLRNADFGMRNGEKADCKCPMADDECQMADDRCQVAEGELQVAEGELKTGDEQCEMETGGCDEESSEPMTEGSSGPVVGHDSNRVIDDSTWNRSKASNRKNLSQKWPGRRGGNKAKVPRGRRAESRGRAMANRLGRVADGRWPVKPKAASCFVRQGFLHSVVRTTLFLQVTGRSRVARIGRPWLI